MEFYGYLHEFIMYCPLELTNEKFTLFVGILLSYKLIFNLYSGSILSLSKGQMKYKATILDLMKLALFVLGEQACGKKSLIKNDLIGYIFAKYIL